MPLKPFSLPIYILSICATLAPATPTLSASPDSTLLNARSLSMGGAVRALSNPVESARVNPAGLGPQRGFFAGASYATRRSSAFDAFQLTLVDNVTSPLGGAIQYQRAKGAYEQEDLSLGIAAGKKGMWWGFNLRYVHGREQRGGTWENVFTGDVGVLFERPSGTRFAAVAYNLADPSLSFLERKIAGGIAQTGVGNWNLAADLVRNLDRDFDAGLDLHLGAEYQLSDRPWSLRLGHMWRGDNGKDYQSLGASWRGESWGLGYAVQMARQENTEILHVLSAEGSF